MTASHNSGPMISYGKAGTGDNNPDMGPGADFQGSSVIDVRYPYQPGKTGKGQVVATLNYAYACLADYVPPIKSNVLIAAAATPVVPAGGSVAMTLASTNSISPATNGNRAVNVPVVPFGKALTSANTVLCMALDPGHTVGTTASGSAAVTSVGDNRLIILGQWVCIPGGAGGTTALVAKVIAKTGTTGITLDRTAGAALTGAPIMLMENRLPTDPSLGTSVVPWYYAGAVAEIDPHGTAVGRVISVTSSANDVTFTVTVTGYDAFLVPMTETITVGNATTVNGQKAWKYITGATLNKSGGGTPTGTISIGVADIFGMAVKAELWEYLNVYWAGAFVSTNTGWTAAVTTTATSTTGDTRGSYAVQSASDGSKRLAVFSNLAARQLIGASYEDPTSLFGVTQA